MSSSARAPRTTTAPSPSRAERPAYRWMVLAVICLGTFMGALDSSIVNVAFPTLTETFHVSVTTISWVSIVYLLTSTVLMTVFGRLADIIGRKRIYTFGFLVFVGGSALCGASVSAGTLIGARALQAVGSAMLVANSVAILTATFPDNQRGTALGFLETAVAAALTVGPTLGGFLIDWIDWRAIFYVNVPIALLGALLAWAIIVEPPRTGRREPFDIVGACCFAAGAGALLLALTQGPNAGWAAPEVLGLFAAALVLLPLFTGIELRVPAPMIQLAMFRERVFAAANLAKIFAYMVMASITFLMPFYLEDALGFSPNRVGLALTPLPIALSIGSLVAGPLSDKVGSHVLCPVGMAVAAVGAVLLARVEPSGGYGQAAIALFLAGLGSGIFISPNDSAIMGAAPPAKLGVAGGILAMTRSLGMISGITFAGTLFSARMAALGGPSPATLVSAFHLVFAVAVLPCLIAMAISLIRGRAQHGHHAAEAG